jgi:hypothetical protein
MWKQGKKARELGRPTRRGAISTAPALGGALAIAAIFALSAGSYAQPAPRGSATPSAFQAAMERNYKNLFEAALISGAQAPNGATMPLDRLLAMASRDGLQRLDDGSIGELIRLRSELVRQSDTATCAGIWSGSSGGGLVPAIKKLPAGEQQRWAALFNRAAQATIDRVPIRPAPTPDQYQPALNRMLSAVPPNDVDAINTAINGSGSATLEQECSAVRAFYGGMLRANPADAVVITRALLYK